LRIAFDFDGIDTRLEADHAAYIRELIRAAGVWLETSLQVKRTTAPIRVASSDVCGDELTVPSKYISGSGVNADVLIFALSRVGGSCDQSLGYIAYASHCQQDQNDRPTVGYIQMCPDYHTRKTIPSQQSEDFHTAVHEILHILGWSNALFPFFRNSDGTPRTPRCPATMDGLPAGVQGYSQDKTYSESDYCCASNTVGKPPFRCAAE
jgi:hypothetical protein